MNQLQSLGLILDGDRRFARERGLPISAGYQSGYDKVKEVLVWAREAKIKTIYLYAFSTENWQRPRPEVAIVMKLFEKFLKSEIESLRTNDTRLIFIGDLNRLPKKLKTLAEQAMMETKSCQSFTLVIAMSYGGRLEILEGAKLFAKRFASKLETTTEKDFATCLWTAGLPDPDLIIRTGGDERLSNFLTWQAVYSELHFTKTYWPALTRGEFDTIITNYHDRQRRFGK